MIVREQRSRSVVAQRRLDDFAYRNGCAVDRAAEEFFERNQSVVLVEPCRGEDFVFVFGETQAEPVGDYRRFIEQYAGAACAALQ